jgi:hypothetical protein
LEKMDDQHRVKIYKVSREMRDKWEVLVPKGVAEGLLGGKLESMDGISFVAHPKNFKSARNEERDGRRGRGRGMGGRGRVRDRDMEMDRDRDNRDRNDGYR